MVRILTEVLRQAHLRELLRRKEACLASLMASQMASLARACSSRADGMSEQFRTRACTSQSTN